MAGVGSADNAFAALNRFEETVSKEEATAKAFDQLASTGKDDDLEAQFAQLGGHGVDAELEALKRERQGGKSRPRRWRRRTCPRNWRGPAPPFPSGSRPGTRPRRNAS